MRERYDLHFGSQDAQSLILDDRIVLNVRNKVADQEGTTPYYLSYSFKGEQENNPIIPQDLVSIARDLGRRLTSEGSTIIAMDRGGTALGVALSIETNLPLYIAFGYKKPRGNGIFWEEPGGGKYLGIPNLESGTHVVLLDDEVNSGVTILNAVSALRGRGVEVGQALVVVEFERRQQAARVLIEEAGCRLDALYKVPEPILDKESGIYLFPSS